MKKIAADIIILSKINHMMYGSSDTDWDRIFCPFTPLTTWKIKILKNWKKNQKMPSNYLCAPKITTIWYMVPEIWSVKDKIWRHFGPICSFTPLTTQKIKIFKTMKKKLEILSFYTCAPKTKIIWFMVPET